MRLFVAAEPSSAVKAAAAECARELRAQLDAVSAGRGIRWIPAANLHLTVWFLGDVSEPRTAAVLDALAPPLEVPAFELHVSGFGAFPPSGPPRVLWMGVSQGLEELAAAHDEVGRRLHPWGFPAEGRAYSAHLTVARIKEPPHGAARAAIRRAVGESEADAGRCRIEALTVFRSRTAPSGPVYEPLLRVPLS